MKLSAPRDTAAADDLAGTPAAAAAVAARIETELAAARERVEAALTRTARWIRDAAPAAVAEPAVYGIAAGGKRLRPILCLAAYRAVADADPPDAAHDLACALELIHTYSLVHDDLPCMDDDDLRRGRPTTHRTFGVAPALVAGAALIPLAVRLTTTAASRLGLADDAVLRLARELCGAVGAAGMVGGQVLDLEAEGRSVGLGELETIHRAKTGALLTAALRIGGIAAAADEHRLEALTEYGRAVGLAFQIADDILDVTASSATLGKTAGKDAAVGKSTYPALLGLDAARERAHDEVEAGIAALAGAGIQSADLTALARYAAVRTR